MNHDKLIDSFLSHPKSLLVSPAGYGKTHTIMECIKKVDGKSLVLTHTHAGIAAIKKKLNAANVSKEKYQVETITSYAQKYVKSFYVGEIPSVNDRNYWQFILEKAAEILKISHIKDVIKSSYKKLFVDEYQDCTQSQHKMILTLSEILPTHILGDPLQGIMEFDEELVNFNDDLNGFEKLPELNTPHRWYQDGNNRQLGDFLKDIRTALANDGTKSIDFASIATDTVIFISTTEDIYDNEFLTNKNNQYKKCIWKLINNPDQNPLFESLLILIPEYNDGRRPRGNIYDRVSFKNMVDFGHRLELLEAIDSKDFYNLATSADELILNICNASNPIVLMRENVLEKLFNKTDLNGWFNDNGIKNKRDTEAKKKAETLSLLVSGFTEKPSPKALYVLVKFLKDGLKLKNQRFSLLKSILDSLNIENTTSVYEAMVNQRNRIRRVGRKVEGKCLGTTALTKGLEFDTVAVLDAHNIKCPKNLYVALTRASKKLIIFSKTTKLEPTGT